MSTLQVVNSIGKYHWKKFFLVNIFFFDKNFWKTARSLCSKYLGKVGKIFQPEFST